MYFKIGVAVVILLLIITIIYYSRESFTVDNIDFDSIFSGGSGKMVYPELDEKCQKLYNDKNAFYDGDTKKCYTCGKADRNPSVIAGQTGSCKGLSYSPAEIINTNTCKEDNSNWYRFGSGCFECPDGYERDGLLNICRSGNEYVSAFIGAEAEGPKGLEYCPDEYKSAGSLCWKCPNGYESRIGLVEDSKKCVDKRPAGYISVQSCKDQYEGKKVTDYKGNPFFCMDAGCGAYKYPSGTIEHWCWGCPIGKVRNIAHGLDSSKACTSPNGKSWGPVRWIRKCRPLTGYPTQDAYPDYTLAGGKYWKCPDGYKKVAGLWDSKNICQRFSPADYFERETCKDKYAGTRVEAFINTFNNTTLTPVSSSNNTSNSMFTSTQSSNTKKEDSINSTSTSTSSSSSNNDTLILSDTAVGWDPIGNCFACPDGYNRTGLSVKSDQACLQPSESKKPSLRRTALGPLGCDVPKNVKSYNGPIDGCNYWKCPKGYDNMIFEPYTSKKKCVKYVPREPARLLGSL